MNNTDISTHYGLTTYHMTFINQYMMLSTVLDFIKYL